LAYVCVRLRSYYLVYADLCMLTVLELIIDMSDASKHMIDA